MWRELTPEEQEKLEEGKSADDIEEIYKGIFISQIQEMMEDLMGHPDNEPYENPLFGITKESAEVLCLGLEHVLREIWKCKVCGDQAVCTSYNPSGEKSSLCMKCFVKGVKRVKSDA